MDGVEAAHISPRCVNIYSGGKNGDKKIRSDCRGEKGI